MSDEREGWLLLLNARKRHYFRKMRSLCGAWMNLSNSYLEKGNDDSPNNCKICQKKLAKEKEKEKEKEKLINYTESHFQEKYKEGST